MPPYAIAIEKNIKEEIEESPLNKYDRVGCENYRELAIVDADKELWRRCPWIPITVATSKYLSKPACYELALGLSEGPLFVVYVGESKDVNQRIRRHCSRSNGTKKLLIKEAEGKGWTIWVRVRYAHGKDDAKHMESELLKKYDYAWNLKENGKEKIRAPIISSLEALKKGKKGSCNHMEINKASNKPIRIYYPASNKYKWPQCGCQGKRQHRANCQLYPNRIFNDGEFNSIER
jgi:hypothetical protein